jgi:membrane protease YdiL (CAAX protease family)
MYENDSKGISYTAGFFMLIAFAVAGIIIASIISIPIWTNMTGKSILDMEKYMTDPAYSNAIKVIQSITAVVGFFVPAVLTAFLLNHKPFNLLGFTGRINYKQLGLVIVIVFAALVVSGALSGVNEQIPVSPSWKMKFDKMEKDYMQQVEAIVGLDNIWQLLLSIFIMAFLPALCEETLFRGGLQNFLTRSAGKPWIAIVVVSIIFSLSHFSYYGFLSRMFLGIVLGLLYYYSGRLWISVAAHFLNNALAISMLYIYKMQGKPIDEAMGDTATTGYWGFLMLPVLIALLILFRKMSPQPLKEPIDPEREELRNTPFY